MTHLIATGIDGKEYWRRELSLGEVIRLGRAPRNGWAVPWDLRVSREHADLELVDKGLQVTVLETARNPILFKKKKLKEFIATPGDSFQIGRTYFQFHDLDSVQSASTELVEYLFTNREMRDYQFKDAQRCLESMCEVPRLMTDSLTDEDFATKTVELLLEAMPDVAVVAVIQFDSSADYDVSEPKLIRWNSHKETETRFEPSRRLMAKVLQRRCNAIHLWEESQGTNEYTMSGDLDWAFCTPIPSNEDRWCLYISGRRQFEGLAAISSPTDLVSELRFAELVANFIGASHKVRSLERQQNEMTNYFSPSVVESLLKGQGKSLEPSEGEVSVLFCDIRGFSHKVEESRGQLDDLLKRISLALSVMTQNILRYEGVIADFQGDSSLAFWGWPNPLDDDALSACRTAIAIQNTFSIANQEPEHQLYGYQVGIALGHGLAIAGRIGSDQQTKVGVFGPVVNLTSRLDGIGKIVGASIVVDGEMAKALRNVLPSNEGKMRFVARMRPQGMNDPIEVYQVLPVSTVHKMLSEQDIATYEQAAQEVIAGQWDKAQQRLAKILPDDGPACFLRALLDEYSATPPANWDGAINLTQK